jgi:hypothetical protein
MKYCKYNDNRDLPDCTPQPFFVGGTIFVFNNKYFDLFKKIKNMDYEYSILQSGYIVNAGENENSRTHAWEYLFGYLVYLNKENIRAL